jgi:hypothetical protein
VRTADGPPLPLHTAGSFLTLLIERWRLVCAVNNRRGEPDNYSIPTNDARDLVAKMLFPDEPVRAITKRDAWLIDRYRLSIDPHYLDHYRLSDSRHRGLFGRSKNFAPNELIAEVHQAYFRLSLQEEVGDWFERRGFDLTQRTIPKHLFEAAVQAEFGQLPPEPVKPLEKYKRNTTDDALVTEAVEGLKSKKFSNVNQAALALAPRAKGSEQANIRRLNRKIGKAYRVKPRQNVSKQIKTNQKI